MMRQRSFLSLDLLRPAEPRLGKTSGMAFRPPLPSPLLQRVISLILPWVMRFNLYGLSVSLDSESLRRLKTVQGQRCLLLPNHPSEWDPWVLLAISKQLGEHFYYLAAREIFDRERNIRGWLLQKMGVYSVVRGAPDKDSFRTTKNILEKNLGRLVIFVEGEISNQNDSLLPLESGVVQLAFLSLLDLYKTNGKNIEALPSLYVCPIALKYFYHPKGLTLTIERSLAALEKEIGLTHTNQSEYERIREVCVVVLKASAQQFGFPLDENVSLFEQVRNLENFMLAKLEHVVGFTEDKSFSYLDRVRRIRNRLDRIIKDIPDNLSPYEHSLHEHQKAVLQNFYRDLDRIVNFIAIYDGYLAPDMTTARMVEIIRRLEKEVFGGYRLVHPRTAVAKVLEPLDIKTHFPAFLEDKKKITETLVSTLESNLYQAIMSAEPRNSF